MNYRQQHPIVFSVGVVLCVCVAIVASIYTVGLYSVEAAKINAEKEKVITEIHEREETERTEENAQFWQKLIPWGNDEEEASK